MRSYKALGALAVIAAASLSGWYVGKTSEHKRMQTGFEGTQATVVVHCGQISEHDQAAREKYFPVLNDSQRIQKAFEAADKMDGYVMIIGNCEWSDQSVPQGDGWMLRRYPSP